MLFGHTRPMMPIVQLFGPEDVADGVGASVWVSMQDCHHGMIILTAGDTVGQVSSVTLDQATDLSGTGSKTLGFDFMFRSGQRLPFTGRSAANFQVGEDVTGGTSNNVLTVTHVSSDHLWGYVITAGSGTGTTWTDEEVLTGGTSGATAAMNGTGTDEDTLVRVTVASDTFDTDTLTFKTYVIPVDHTMLDADNDYSHFQLDLSDEGSGSTFLSAIFVPLAMRTQVSPQVSLIETQKIS